MKLYHGKGSCSLGILILLEEVDAEYEVVSFNLADGDHQSLDYRALNPKAKVPMLQVSQTSCITEWPAIGVYLAAAHPERRLLPTDPMELARTLAAVDYVVSTIHMQGFSRIARPGNFSPTKTDHEAVVARGREIFEGGLDLMDQGLQGRDFVAGDFTIADAALFYVEDWKTRRLGGTLPARCQAHYERMLGRDSVQRAMERGS
jgi:glutathione S-transferase